MSSDEPGDRPVSGMHVPALDGLRGLAVLLVTLYRFGLDPADNSVIGRLAHPLFAAGESGVDLFFVLSGFLITGILADTKERSHYLRNFYMRRVLRIFPLYYGGLALAFWGGEHDWRRFRNSWTSSLAKGGFGHTVPTF